MKEQLKKADLLGLIIIAASTIALRTTGVKPLYLYIAIGLGAALVVSSLAVKQQEICAGLGRRSTRFGINSATSVILIVGVLAMVNYLGAQHQKRVDMTTEKIYSLSDESSKVADQVKQNLHIKAFYPGGEYPPVKDLLNLFHNRNQKITFEWIDPDKQPEAAKQAQVTAYGEFQNPMSGESFRYGTLILQMGDKTERIEKQSEPLREEDITNNLTKIVKGEKKTVYFVDGHGEKKIDDNERGGYSQAKSGLERESYVVKSVNLASENKVPDDATILVLAGPAAELFPNEVEMIENYLKGGGNVMMLLDPPPATGLKDFLHRWGVDPGDNLVVDASGVGRAFGMSAGVPLVTSYPQHAITAPMRVMTFFPLVRSITPVSPAPEGVTVDKLLETNERSWGETDTKGSQARFDDGKDVKGPVTIAAAISRDAADKKKARLVVFGDSDFASNVYFGQAGNGNLFSNTVNWLARDENFISIKPKSPDDRRLELTEAQGRLVNYAFVLLLPAGILIAGISVWMRRRK